MLVVFVVVSVVLGLAPWSRSGSDGSVQNADALRGATVPHYEVRLRRTLVFQCMHVFNHCSLIVGVEGCAT